MTGMSSRLRKFLSEPAALFSAGQNVQPLFHRPITRILRNLTMAAGITAMAFVVSTFTPEKANAAGDYKPLPSVVETAHSDWVAKVNQSLTGVKADGRIIVMADGDKVAERLGLNDDPTSIAARHQRIADVLTEARDGLQLNEKTLTTVDKYLSEDRAVSFGTSQVCIVVPGDPDLSGLTQISSLSGINAQSFKPTIRPPSSAYMQSFTALHELGHCLEGSHITQMTDGSRFASLINRHRGEVFADVFAVLSMGDEVGPKMAGWLSDIRTLGSNFKGPRLTTPGAAQEDWGDYGGVIYHTGPALSAAQAEMKKLGPKLNTMSTEDKLNLAGEITAKYALSAKNFQLLNDWHRDPAKISAEAKASWAANDPRRLFLNDIIYRYSALKQAYLATEPSPHYTNAADASLSARVKAWQDWAATVKANPEHYAEAVRLMNEKRDELRRGIDDAPTVQRISNENELRAIDLALFPPAPPEPTAKTPAPTKAAP